LLVHIPFNFGRADFPALLDGGLAWVSHPNGAGAATDADACDNDTQFGADDSGSPRRPVIRIRTIMRTVAMSMAM
jgi:hypothetical protein